MRKEILINGLIFKSQNECETYTRKILTDIGVTNSLKKYNTEYFDYFISLCKRHPHSNEKLKQFVDFQICRDALNPRGMALNIINDDGSSTEISWKICVTGKAKTSKSKFNAALRQCISNQIKDFRNKSDLSFCKECKCSLFQNISHIDHYEPQFAQLVDDFVDLNKELIVSIPTEYKKKEITFETLFKDEDSWIGKLFEEYHLKNATLRVLCEKCNITRAKYKKET